MKTTIIKSVRDSEMRFELEGDWKSIQAQIGEIDAYFVRLEEESGAASLRKKALPKASSPNNNKKVRAKQSHMMPNLLNKDDILGVKGYLKEKVPESHIERYLVLVLWLRDNKDYRTVGADEIWTLYKILNVKPPKNIVQVFRDGKSKKGLFELDDETGKYYITDAGEVFVIHDLPRKDDERND